MHSGQGGPAGVWPSFGGKQTALHRNEARSSMKKQGKLAYSKWFVSFLHCFWGLPLVAAIVGWWRLYICSRNGFGQSFPEQAPNRTAVGALTRVCCRIKCWLIFSLPIWRRLAMFCVRSESIEICCSDTFFCCDPFTVSNQWTTLTGCTDLCGYRHMIFIWLYDWFRWWYWRRRKNFYCCPLQLQFVNENPLQHADGNGNFLYDDC